MRYFIQFLSISLWWNLLFCAATVSVSLTNSAANRNDSLECGSDGTVYCRSDANIITWEINGTDYALCAPVCEENPASTRHYSPTYDVTNGVFTLTVDSATFSDNRTTFKCDDGSSFDSITIEVVPAYSENKTNITNDGKQIEFTTACVQHGVEFEWFTVKTDISERKKYNQGQHEITNDTVCSDVSSCGGYGTVKVSSIITISTDPDGEEHYLEVDVTYNNPHEKRRFRFDEIFVFKVPKCKLPFWLIILLIYIGRWIQHLTSYFAGSLLYTLYQKNPSEISKTTLFLICLICIPVIGSFVAVVLCCTNLSKDIKKSCRVFKVLGGYLPLLGNIYTAYLLIRELKDSCSCEKCKPMVLFTISWIFDIGIFVLMILTCIDKIEVPCYLYGVYALAGLICSWVNFVCLAECLQNQAENNKIGNETQLQCDSCKQLMKTSEAELKCFDCSTILCDVCTQEHLKRRIALRNKKDYVYTLNENNKLRNRPKPLCDSCKKSIAELKCIYCNTVLCEKCKQGHMKTHIPQRNAIFDGQTQNENNKPKLFCDLCKEILKESTAELNCFDCYRILCEACTQEHRKKHTKLKNNKIGNQPKLLCELCKESKAELYCFECKKVLCEKCSPEHLKSHSKLENNKIGKKTKLLCDSCKKWKKESSAELICLYCNTVLCEKCKLEHLKKHNALRKERFYCQTQNENEKTAYKPILQCDSCKQMEIESKAKIKCFDCNEVLCEECTEDHLIRHNQMRNYPSYGQTSNNMNHISGRFICSSCEKHVESYCLKCEQFLCKACIKNHLGHKILRHCQQETGKTRFQIFCKLCQNKPAASDDHYGKCKRCEENNRSTCNPVECRCMVYNEEMCAVCFEEIRRQSILLHDPIKARKNVDAELCALHSVLGLPVTQHLAQTDIRKVSSDVYCLVCNEYLCTRCFFLHLNLKQLWQQQQFDTEFVQHNVEQIQPKSHKKRSAKDNDNAPFKRIFTACFPVFGVLVITCTLHKKIKQEQKKDKYCLPPSC